MSVGCELGHSAASISFRGGGGGFPLANALPTQLQYSNRDALSTSVHVSVSIFCLQGYPEVVEEYATDSSTTENQHCFYLFEWATSNVCNKAAAGRLIVCKPTGLGAGSIFLIV